MAVGVDTLNAPAVARPRLSARARSRRRGFTQQGLLALITAGLAWRTIELYQQQQHALFLPGAVLGAPLAVLLIVTFNRMPGRETLPADLETDVIVCLMFAVLGAWFLYSTPGRLGVLFWLWRPDVLGSALCALAVAALVGGSGLVLYLIAPVLVAAIVMCPLPGLVLSQHSGSLAMVAVGSALGAAAPLMVARPLKVRSIWRYPVLAAGCGAAATVFGHVDHMTQSRVSLAAALLSLVVIEILVQYERRPALAGLFGYYPRGIRGARLSSFRVFAGIALAVGCGALDRLIPQFDTASGRPVAALLTVGVDQTGSLSSPGGLRTMSWSLPVPAGGRELGAEAFTSTASSAAAVLSYPLEGLINFLGAQCPREASRTIDGNSVSSSEYANDQAGTMWNVFTWNWHTGGRYQRVAVVLEYGLQGHAPQLPALVASGGANGIHSAGLFLANRHIVCSNSSFQQAEGAALSAQLMRSVGT